VDQILARYRSDDGLGFHLTDRMGSVRAIADDSGAVLSQTDYSSFGEIISQTNPEKADQFGFTGRELDAETDLYYFRARAYDANLGRFISQDPIGFGAGDVSLSAYSLRGPPEWGAHRLPGSPDINAYRYGFNNAQGLVDLFGLAATPYASKTKDSAKHRSSLCIVRSLVGQKLRTTAATIIIPLLATNASESTNKFARAYRRILEAERKRKDSEIVQCITKFEK